MDYGQEYLRPIPVFAISPELVKKCRAIAIKADPKMPAGALRGTEEEEQQFYLRCVDRNGDIEYSTAHACDCAPAGTCAGGGATLNLVQKPAL
jgi:hypothetical protein